jgi:heme A synthase
MAAPRRSKLSDWNRALTLLAAALLCATILFGAAFARYALQADSYTATYVVISAWAAASFVLLSLLVLASSLFVRHRAAGSPDGPVVSSAAISLVALAWVIIALVWAAASAYGAP